MKRFVAGLPLVAGALLMAAPPAFAQTSFDLSRYIGHSAAARFRPLGGGSLFQSCLATDNTVRRHTPCGSEELELASLAACVSSLQSGRVSWLASTRTATARGRLRLREPDRTAVPLLRLRQPELHGEHRLDCLYFLWSFTPAPCSRDPAGHHTPVAMLPLR